MRTLGEMQAYLRIPENGLVFTAQDSSLKVWVQCLPTAFLQKRDSIQKERYTGSVAFIVKLQPVHPSGTDFLIEAAENPGEYDRIIQTLNFEPETLFSLETSSGVQVKPVLATLENAFESGPSKSVFLVFPNRQGNGALITDSEQMKLVFNNPFEGQATFSFVFKGKDYLHFNSLAGPA
ncbi:MAG: hypothetical protein V4543_09695 [Bacteroidota bacterium]